MIEKLSHIDSEDFYEQYVSKRKPCILTTIPDDLQCLTACQDLEALREHAGNVEIAVEPISARGTFGTSATKSNMTMASFLKSIQNGEKLYLTTQYSEVEDSAILNEPLKTLRKELDIPIMPDLARDLVPAKINMWLGSSSNGTSSGLHHDFHDNFYILLAGKKHFRIFPPSWKNCKQLNLNAQPHEIFENGLISYGNDLNSNGLTRSTQAQIQVDLSEQELLVARETGEDIEEAEQHYEDAMDRLLDAKMDDEDEEEDGDFDDNSEDSEGRNEGTLNGDQMNDEDQNEDLSGIPGLTTEEEDSLSTLPEFGTPTKVAPTFAVHEEDQAITSVVDPVGEPPSFSTLSSEEVKLKLADETLGGIAFDLEPGQMLYLPASYFHEVISSRENHDFHMAVNYWFYPPDGKKSSYLETSVMTELQRRASEDYPITGQQLRGKKVKI